MIIGHVLIDGNVFSTHRFPDANHTQFRVRRQLRTMAEAEGLHVLGRLEIRTRHQGGLERLMAALWGTDEVPTRRGVGV